MRNTRFLFWFIALITIVAVIIDLPTSYPLKIHWKKINFETTVSRPFSFLQKYKVVKGLDLAGGVHLMFKAKMDEIPKENQENAFVSLKENIDRRVNLFGLSEAVVQTSEKGEEKRLVVELPGVADIAGAIELVGKTAELDFREEVELPPEATATATIYDVFSKETGLSGRHLLKAAVEFDSSSGKPAVSLEFNEEGKKLFGEITEKNVGKRVAIFLDDVPLSAPEVKEKISEGKAIISGNFTLKEAKGMVSQLNAGALPAPLTLIEQRQIGPALGSESVAKSLKAGAVGLAAVLLFMVVLYRGLGVLADFGLIIYALLTLALYKIIPVTVTLPGLTGFLLSVGMAVDSNILIFERLKEELKDGRPYNAALELAFGRAWDSIRDANICTLITCFLLFNPFGWSFLNSSGTVRGFAVTLALGIFVSLFTGVVVTRTLLRTFTKKVKN